MSWSRAKGEICFAFCYSECKTLVRHLCYVSDRIEESESDGNRCSHTAMIYIG